MNYQFGKGDGSLGRCRHRLYSEGSDQDVKSTVKMTLLLGCLLLLVQVVPLHMLVPCLMHIVVIRVWTTTG